MSSSLASSHFRNHLRLFPGHFSEFKNLAESTWPGLRIYSLDGKDDLPGSQLALIIMDGEFTAEVVWMGHGLQMWLQTMWFLARSKGSTTIILDEPDVYMHADLQRKLIRILKGRHEQIIVATHSIEIMAEVEPDDILVVDRMRHKSSFASSAPAVQRVINSIGGVHNLQLARLWSSNRCLLVEGKDIAFLKILQNILFPKSQESFETIPHMSIGGWGGWSYAIGSSMLTKNAVGENIVTYCIFDSDYHTEDEKKKRADEASKRGVQLHIWKKKEIENYAVVPTAISRIIASGIDQTILPPTIEEVEHEIDGIVERHREIVFSGLATELHAADRAGGVPTALARATAIVNEAWKTREGRIAIVSGKAIISELSKWSQGQYGVSFSAARVFHELRHIEIDREVIEVVTAIEKGQPFCKP